MKRFLVVMLCVMTSMIAFAQKEDNRDEIVKCAQEGEDKCQNLLGKWLFEGSHGYKQDYGKAVAWWLQAAKQNNVEAIANLGFCYQYGWGVDSDSLTAARLFEKSLKLGNTTLVRVHDSLAHEGSVFSAMFLGKCYKLAYGVKRDESASQRYYQMAAEHGNVEAMREAAILMRSAKDDFNALAMFKKAMQHNDAIATYYYGKMLCEGRGTAIDAETGVAYIHQAAEQDYATAQYELAEAYNRGNGVRQDAKEALTWYNKAALFGNRTAWWKMAECYREGRGTEIDYEEALECYAKAWTLGYHNKIKALLTEDDSEWKDTPFMYYLRGRRLLDIDNNPDAAIKEFAELPKQMAVRKTMEVLCMIHPNYSKHNEKKAVRMLQKVAQESCCAAFELALLQMEGKNIEKDVDQAEKTLKALADSGYFRAVNYLADCYYEGNVFDMDKAKAVGLYLKSEWHQRLTTIGASRLAQAFRNGEGVEVNTSRADELDKYKAYNIKTILEKVNIL